MKIEALDPSTPLMRQFQEKTGPITLVNVFDVPRSCTRSSSRSGRRTPRT